MTPRGALTRTWIDATATTLATNARGRYVHSMRPTGEVPVVKAAIAKELEAAYRRGRRAAGWIGGGVGTGVALAAHMLFKLFGWFGW